MILFGIKLNHQDTAEATTAEGAEGGWKMGGGNMVEVFSSIEKRRVFFGATFCQHPKKVNRAKMMELENWRTL